MHPAGKKVAKIRSGPAAPGVGDQIHCADPDTCGAQRRGEDPDGANQLH